MRRDIGPAPADDTGQRVSPSGAMATLGRLFGIAPIASVRAQANRARALQVLSLELLTATACGRGSQAFSRLRCKEAGRLLLAMQRFGCDTQALARHACGLMNAERQKLL